VDKLIGYVIDLFPQTYSLLKKPKTLSLVARPMWRR